MESENNNKGVMIKLPYQKIRHAEWVVFAAIVLIIVVAILTEVGLFKMPSWALQKTGDNAIYQTLFSAQASMVGVVLAILALIINVVETKIYGLSVTRYVMTIRPSKFFRHGWIIVETIVLIILTWFCVALNLNNIAVAIFVSTTVLLVRLTLDVLSILYSNKRLDDEIGRYIIATADSAHIVNLFGEISEAIISGNSVLLQTDIDYAKGLIPVKLKEMTAEDTAELLDLFSTIIHKVYESNSSKVSDILDLYITTVEAANDIKMSFSLPDILSLHEVFQLFSKTSMHELYGITGKMLLFRWQKAVLINVTIASIGSSNLDHVASLLYNFAYKNNENSSLKTGLNILQDSQSIQNDYFLRNNAVSKEVAERNYLDLIMTMFKERNEQLLNTLLGFDGSEVGITFTPVCNRYGDFEFTKINTFIVIYLFYLSYRETNVNGDEKKYCEDSLKKISQPFWQHFSRYAHQYPLLLSQSKEMFDFFIQKMYIYERHDNFTYGSSGVKAVIFEEIVLDFLSFSFAYLALNEEQLENLLKSILTGDGQWPGTTLFVAFDRYVINNSLENFSQLYTVMCGHHPATAEAEYDRLKSALTNLYRSEQIEKAIVDSAKFSIIRSESEQVLDLSIKSALLDFSSQYSRFSADDTPHYRPYTFTLYIPISGGKSPVDSEEFTKHLIQHLNAFLFAHIRDNLKLTEVIRGEANVSLFIRNISDVSEVDLLYGHALFSYDDPDYEKYLAIKERCEQVDSYALRVYTAIESQLIRIGIRNSIVRIRSQSESEIKDEVERGKVLNINGHTIPLDDRTAHDYLMNSRRIIEVSFEIAIKCTAEIVGGGLLYKDEFKHC